MFACQEAAFSHRVYDTPRNAQTRLRTSRIVVPLEQEKGMENCGGSEVKLQSCVENEKSERSVR